MNKNKPLKIAGLVFSIVALLHLLRIIYQWQIVIAGVSIPLSVSVIALIVAAVLAMWMFKAAMN